MIFGNKNPKTNDPTKIKTIVRNKISEESEKFAESLKTQVFGEKKTGNEMSMMEDLLTQGGKVNPILSQSEEQSIAAHDKKRLAEIEAEIRQMRYQRSKSENEYSEKIQSAMDAGKATKDESPVVMPSGVNRRARTPGAGGKGKSKGSGEMLKSKK